MNEEREVNSSLSVVSQPFHWWTKS